MFDITVEKIRSFLERQNPEETVDVMSSSD